MKEAFGIAAVNTKWRKDFDKIKRDQKARLQPLEVGGRVLVRNLNLKGGPSKTRAFLEQKVYKILEKKEDGLIYAVQEESYPHAGVRVLHRNNLLSCHSFQALKTPTCKLSYPLNQQRKTRQATAEQKFYNM